MGKQSADLLRPIRALISDLDGTLVAGNRPQPGLIAFLDFLRRRGVALTVVTNNTVRSSEQYSRKLAGLGASVPPDRVVTASEATAEYLRNELRPGAPLFVVGESGLRSALSEAGFALVDDGAQPVEAVVVGGDRTVDYARLKYAIRHVLRGARFIGANPDLLVPTDDGLAPEAGVLLAAIAAGAGKAPRIIGKPERPLFELALRRMDSAPAVTAVLGDRLDTDILGGQRLGLTTILVTTGASDASAISTTGIVPDLVVSGLQELADLWEEALNG